jgi:hypothetical protein
MSIFQTIAAVIVLAGAAIGVIGVITLVAATQRRPYNEEKAPVRSSPAKGVIWSFTLGMAPWKKESARIHWIAYLRGIILHISIFIGAAFLMVSPWLGELPEWLRFATAIILAIGTLVGLAGFWIRWHDPILKELSIPDDYFALALTTLFVAAGTIAALSINLASLFWIVSGITMAYVPFGKLRHFIYFFYSRAFLGMVLGRRGALE